MRTAALVAAAAVLSYLDHTQQNKTHGAWIGTTPRYNAYGDRAKPPLILIPGLDGCTVFFQGVVPELVRDFFVVVYELPLYNGQNYTFSYLASDVASALDELDIERASIIGESFGGVVAQHVALEHSERVEALVLLSSLAKTELTAVVKFKLHVLLPVVELLGRAFPGIAQTIFAKVHASDVVEASEPAWARSLFVKEASWAHHASVMRRIKIVAALDIDDRVPSIAVPVLLIRGAEDTFTGHTTARLRALLQSRGQVRTFPGGAVDVVTLPGGHLPHVTSSDLFARAVRDALFVVQMEKMPESEWHANYVRELNKNPFFNTTDVDIALTSTGYVSWRAVEELKK
jgi:pimeloyl-ACP methyl ester carboxylesterase